MKSHDLAKLLLEIPNLPMAVLAHGHLYSASANQVSHGPLQTGILRHYAGPHIIVGNMLDCIQPHDNWSVEEIIRTGKEKVS
jgi:hypothetical protein